MHKPFVKTIVVTALLGLSVAATAAEMTDTTRDQRMDAALQDYRAKHPNSTATKPSSRKSMAASTTQNDQPGTFARAEESTKRGAKRAGHAVKNGAEKVGGAVSTAAEKTRDALRNTGEKIESKLPPKPAP